MSKAAQAVAMAVKETGDADEAPAKAKKPRSATAGIRQEPKLKALLLSSASSRAVVLKALQIAKDDAWTDMERAEVARLMARLMARGAGKQA
jgi:hypothetical protein